MAKPKFREGDHVELGVVSADGKQAFMLGEWDIGKDGEHVNVTWYRLPRPWPTFIEDCP